MVSNADANRRNLLDSAAQAVRDRITPGSPLYTLLNDVSPSPENGMNRTSNMPARSGAAEAIQLPKTHRLFRSTEIVNPQIGDMPPQPPTLRGRVGAAFVRIIQRMLFWYTAQIRAFHKTAAEAAGEQAYVLQRFDAEQGRQLGLLSATVERLTALENQLTDNQARALKDQGTLTDRLDLLADEVSSLHSETVVPHIAAANQWRKEDRLEMESIVSRVSQIELVMASAQQTRSSSDRCVSHDSLFVDHARSFRGDQADIKSRLNVYVPYAKEAFADAACAPALDLGCGRGEWLELLRDLGIPAAGIDWNRDLVNANRERGLDVIEGEILKLLTSLPDQSRSILTAFHVLEHLPFADLVEMIDHAVRILKPGGIAIFETPNPRNLFVSTNNFYLDPTHQHPIPSEFLSFAVEARGLRDPRVIPLSPFPDCFHLEESDCPAVSFINEHFYGPQDYGLVALKR